MPVENNWNVNMRHAVCGFFHAQSCDYEPHLDQWGNSYLVKSFLIDQEDKLLKKKELSADDYAIYCSQRANSPSEAFNIETENIFSSTELSDYIKYMRANQATAIYREGQYSLDEKGKSIFQTNDELRDKGERIHPYITNVPFKKEDDVFGCWRNYREPKRIGGLIPDNLYYIVVDSVGKDKTLKEVTIKNSLNAMYVLSYPNDMGIPGDMIQAVYVGRRDDSQEACSIEALKAAEYWNAKVLPETDRGTVVNDFKRWNKTHRLIKNPLAVINNKVKDSTINDFGVYIGEGDNAVDGIINLKRWLYEIINVNEDGSFVYRLHYIPDLPTLLELQQYNIKGNFDRISALRVLTFERLAYVTKKKKPTAQQGERTFLSQVGLYRNN